MKKEIIKLHKEGLNDSQIGKLIGVTPGGVLYWRKKLGLKSNYSPEQRHTYNNDLIENEKLLPVLIGTLLGDASLHLHPNTKGKSGYGSFSHCLAQKDYAMYKYELLKPICTPPTLKKVHKTLFKQENRYIDGQDQIVVRLKANPNLRSLYDVLYPNGKKTITEQVLKYFEDISLALLYCDDGNRQKAKRGKTHYTINTCGFDRQSLETFQDFLRSKWNINVSIWADNKIYVLSDSCEKFKKLVEPYVIECMKYKLN